MTILGSRDQYCIHQGAKTFEKGVTEACNLLLSGKQITGRPAAKQDKSCKCEFRKNMSKLSGDKGGNIPTKISYKDFQSKITAKE